MPFLYVPETMAYGKERRKFIKDWFNANPDGQYHVNRKYRPQVKNDSDLKKLIRTGFLKQIRGHIWRGHGYSYLVKA